MVRLGISVEGLTEERFVKQVLYPYLQSQNIYVTAVNMNGAVSIARICRELRKLVHNFDYITTLYDFYGFSGKSASDTKESLEDKIKNCIQEDLQYKVIPYVQMYEFEGILFSKPEILSNVLSGSDLEIWANSILSSFNDNPERINNSPQTAPSKRLESNTNYKKTIHGAEIANLIGIDSIRSKCSGFDSWIQGLTNISSPT